MHGRNERSSYWTVAERLNNATFDTIFDSIFGRESFETTQEEVLFF